MRLKKQTALKIKSYIKKGILPIQYLLSKKECLKFQKEKKSNRKSKKILCNKFLPIHWQASTIKFIEIIKRINS